MPTFSIYCDESCHLEKDKQTHMVLGGIWCPKIHRQSFYQRIRDIKKKHGLASNFEIKWTKVSKSKVNFYIDLIDYFFDTADLHFRGIIINKSDINHKIFSQTHDEWYYKMYFTLLKLIFVPLCKYEIYLDIKDTCGGKKVKKLHDVLCNSIYDFSNDVIKRIQLINSQEVELIQLADLIIGALSYKARQLNKNKAKLEIIDRIKKRSNYSLEKSTLYKEEKFNLFFWKPNNI